MDTYGVLLHCEFYNAIKGTLGPANFLQQISQVTKVFPEGFVGITKIALLIQMILLEKTLKRIVSYLNFHF